jgi:hypothetical protein
MLLALLVSLGAVWALVVLGTVALCVAASRADAAGGPEARRPAPSARTRRFAPAA